MRQIIFCLLTLLIPEADHKVVTGTILADGKPIPGCEIKLTGTDLKTITNSNGEYNLSFESDIDRFTLEISFMEKSIYATTQVENVQLSGDSLDLGNLSIFVNKSITVEEYKKLKSRDEEILS